ncbi:helix-turn-helix transcriptional regulator [Flagellimonas sp. 389]|nr:helix-turn-helix transcriptional regulator [Flagellimonas sp. 389]MBS9461189.1 helix-turn-helix transcriptional regulator [Flagellimonas sp. 389]
MYAIKHLRSKKNMSQSDLAKEIGVSLRTIQLYEKKNANIPIKNLTKIAAFFDLSIAELYLQEVNESEVTYTKRQPFTKKGSVFYPLDHGKHLVMVPLVLTEYQKAFLDDLAENAQDNDTFQTGFIVDFLPEENLRAFEITGDSMNDGSIDAIPNKAVVLGLKLKNNQLVKTDGTLWNTAYMLVCKDRIICKWVTGIDSGKKTMYCQNLNKSPEYQDFELSLEDVLQVYKVVKKQI